MAFSERQAKGSLEQVSRHGYAHTWSGAGFLVASCSFSEPLRLADLVAVCTFGMQSLLALTKMHI